MFLRTWRNGPHRVIIQLFVWLVKKPTIRRHQGKRIPSWMSKHRIFWSILKQIHDDHLYHEHPFGALADFNIILKKARTRTVRELSRKTPDSLGAKLLTASTALRAFRNRHLGTLVRCCEAWEPVGKCFDPISFESIDFHGLSQIFASLTRESLAEREAEIGNLSWTRAEKTMPWRNADLDFALGAPRNQCSVFTLLPIKTAILWKTNTNLAGDNVNIGVQSFRRAFEAKGTITMKTSCDTYRKLLKTFVGKSTETNLMNSWPQ